MITIKASTILEKAKSYIGLTEAPYGSNNVIFNTDYYGRPVFGDKYPWCMTFVWDIFRMCGASNIFFNGNGTASCPELMEWAKRKGKFVTGNYKPGDVLFFDFDSIKDGDHTGFCISDNGTTVTTVEGNTSSDDYGSQSNGGGVFRRNRSKSIITGAYRPDYEPEGITGWKQDGGYWYYFIDGEPVRSCWKEIEGKWYYFWDTGRMASAEFVKSSKYSTNKYLYFVVANGHWDGRTYMWQQDNTGWWLAEYGGTWWAKEEWWKVDRKWYYFSKKGYMVANKTMTIDGRNYKFGKDGALIE